MAGLLVGLLAFLGREWVPGPRQDTFIVRVELGNLEGSSWPATRASGVTAPSAPHSRVPGMDPHPTLTTGADGLCGLGKSAV